jgi:myosin heavy subunit
MTTTNLEEQTNQGVQTPRKDYKNAIIGILALALLGLGIYTVTDKNKNNATITQQGATIAKDAVEKSDIQKNFDQSLARLDSMHTTNTALESKLTENNSEIAKTKAEIRHILNKSNATAAELNKARDLVTDLNTKIAGMEAEVSRLTQENKSLTQDKEKLTQDKEKLTQDLSTTTVAKQDLEKKVDIASTLNASNISITPINVKKNGKEKVTSTAKRVDKLIISFDVDNRIIQSGTTDVYVCVLGPDGKPITSVKSGSGTFTTREDGDKAFTAKVSVDLETAKRKKVEFAFTPDNNFEQGSYDIQIYQNGFKIGESKRDLKKGGLFN